MKCAVLFCDDDARYQVLFDCDAIEIVVGLCATHERELMHGGDPNLTEPRVTLLPRQNVDRSATG